MTLSCECGDPCDAEWWYYPPNDFTLFPKARTICCSCKKPIKISEECLKFRRSSCDMFGNEYFLSPLFMCEDCGEIYLNLSALGYCVWLGVDDMRELLKEYHILTDWGCAI